MARPVNRRLVEKPPIMEGFKPFGIPIRDLEPVVLLFEEYEALRLVDHLGLPHHKAARRMKVSRPTFTRICDKARRTLATALVEGKALFIEGGNFRTDDCWYRCESCWKVTISSVATSTCSSCHAENLRQLNSDPPVQETNGNCICTQCNKRIPHVTGKPCRETRCPDCRRIMLREGEYHHQLYLKKKENK